MKEAAVLNDNGLQIALRYKFNKVKNNYLILARKYRPINFSKIYGQDILCKTISNALIFKRLAQAYLLTGIRGIGKTTTARIIAKNINCLNFTTDANNYVIACETCINCKSIANGNHPDIIEIDAASNTGVDNIKELISSSEYQPLLGEYKIFIIDEIQMLSKSAFNALLKTLEEPASHVVFIFATTESHKIPLTIISRCQRFNLKRLTIKELNNLLKDVCAAEKIKYEEEPLNIIAVKSDGSARDALSLLDQAISLSQNNILEKITVDKMICSVEIEVVFNLLLAIIQQNYQEALNILNLFYQNNSDLTLFIDTILKVLAYLGKVKVLQNYQDTEYIQYDKQVNQLIIKLDLIHINLLWQIFIKSYNEIKNNTNQLLIFEMVLIKAIYSNTLPSPKDIVEKALKEELNYNENKLLQLLDHLQQMRTFHLYHYLLEEVEVIEYSNGVLEISQHVNGKQYNKELLDILENLHRTRWNITTTYKDNPIALKHKLLNKFMDSKEWEIIRSSFNQAQIVDILYKKNIK